MVRPKASADDGTGKIHVFDDGLKLAVVVLGDLATEDDGEFVGLTDGAVGIQEALAYSVQCSIGRERIGELLEGVWIRALRESVGGLPVPDAFPAHLLGEPIVLVQAKANGKRKIGARRTRSWSPPRGVLTRKDTELFCEHFLFNPPVTFSQRRFHAGLSPTRHLESRHGLRRGHLPVRIPLG